MRPIINNIGSVTYKLAKWLVSQFQSSHNIKNSLELIDKIKNVQLSDNDKLVSFDVVNLFPCVPKNTKWLQEIGVEEDKIEEYKTLTELCLNETFFEYDGEIYEQNEGLAMGNPLSPFLANLYISFFETHNTDTLPWLFKFWVRYVDDILAIVNEKHVEDALKLLNLQKNYKWYTIVYLLEFIGKKQIQTATSKRKVSIQSRINNNIQQFNF